MKRQTFRQYFVLLLLLSVFFFLSAELLLFAKTEHKTNRLKVEKPKKVSIR